MCRFDVCGVQSGVTELSGVSGASGVVSGRCPDSCMAMHA